MEPPEQLGSTAGSFRKKGSTFSLLVRNRDFRLLFAAMVVSFAGDWFLFVALAGLLFSLTQSPAYVAALYAAMTVPFALATFVGGPLADRFNRQFLMVASDVLRGLLALGFFLVDRPSKVWIVFVLSALISALQAVFEPSAMASIPNLVDREDLAAANVLAAATWGTMLTVGSALGGLVVTTLGREAAYVVDAASFLGSAILVLQIRRRFSEERERHHKHPGLVEAAREALRHARKDRRVLALLTVKGGFGLGAGVIALLPVLAFQVYQAGDGGTGILYAFRGIGIVAGPFLIRPFVRDEDLRSVFWAIAAAFAVFAVTYAVVPLMPGIFLAGLFVLAGHLGGGVQWTLSSYALQLIVPDRIRGRILAFDQGLIGLTVAASATLAGWIADYVDVRTVMLGLAAVAGAYAVIWTIATTGIRRSLTPVTEPAVA
ncbi:MAG: MFS transporter [Actinomycetota bacterium]|nr:MFS transporter [Actinomycetota bacterium]